MINQVNQSNLSVPTSQVNQGQNIELYPGNWLYNAGVVGFLISLEIIENKNINNFLKNGQVLLPKKIFSALDVNNRYFSDTKISSIVAKAPIYRNYLKKGEEEAFIDFVKSLENLEKIGKCDISPIAYNMPDNIIQQLKKNGLKMFLNRIENFNMIFHANLGPSLSKFPNSFWNIKQSNKICQLMAYLIIHQHLAFTKLSDNTKIFINAPSFKLMYELNKLVKELSKIDYKFTKELLVKELSKIDYKSTKELLAMSVIEYSLKINAILGNWLLMNIEIVAIDKKNNIEFINIPYNVLRIISNKKIAALLNDIGEFKILNIVLNEKYSELVEIAYRIMRIALKSKRNENDNKFLQDTIFLDKNKGSNYNLLWFSNKILNLYALIKETIKIK
jgi:CRISPR-associated protein Cst1